MRSSALLSIVGSIHPQVWDAVIPHHHYRNGSELVSLNPQPLPPEPPEIWFLVGAADLAHQMAQMAIEQNAADRLELDLLHAWVEDWCGTGWPRKWPIPWPGPRTEQGALPDPWVVKAGQVVAATVLASTASRLATDELSKVLNDLADRLVDAALPG